MADEGAPRVETVGNFEMLWDCESCGTKRLLGKSQRNCGNCGAAQDPNKRYFPKEGEGIEVKNHQFVGADVHCAHCDAPMNGAAKNCTSCGAPMNGSKEVKGVEAPKPVVAPSKGPPWLYIIIGVLLIGGLIYWRCVRTTAEKTTVASHSWTRAIKIQVFGEVHKDDWKTNVPTDATSVSCRREQRDTKKVPDGETCKDENVDNKDGTFKVVRSCTPKTKDEPIMDDKCTFIVLDWKDDAPVEAKGVGLDAKWPDTNVPAAEVARTVGAKRQVGKSGVYTIQFAKKSCDVDETVWRKYTDGQAVTVQVHANGDIACKEL